MGEYTVCTTSLDKQATLHFSYLKTLPWRHNQEIPLFLWGQCSASCAKINMASRQAIQIFSERTAWGGPALVLTVYCKWPSPTGPHVPCTWQHVLSWKCLNNYWHSPCYIICTLKVHWHLWGSEWPEDWGLPSNGHGNHVDGDERGTGRAWGQRFRSSYGRSPTSYCFSFAPLQQEIVWKICSNLFCVTIYTSDSTAKNVCSTNTQQEDKCKWRNLC